MSCWCCLLSIDDRLRRLNRRREYLARILTYVPETDVIVELANHNAGGLTADMMLSRIDEVNTQDSHENSKYFSEDEVCLLFGSGEPRVDCLDRGLLLSGDECSDEKDRLVELDFCGVADIWIDGERERLVEVDRLEDWSAGDELAEILVENVDKSLLLEIKNFLDNVFSATMEKFESLEKADRLEQEEDSDERLEELYGKITQD
ncbi:hypothetical protein B9Z55_008988 [Caenorhabditis nigoni]|uniref:Uncharacterized protein n=2 Tax=Caenorhabditis nigoni TaxID=1611254 RepID=A0A2G5UQ54_9PELO|nr:hypothetical protein B9Z55_008988 [Caenorhabditis nigoni]